MAPVEGQNALQGLDCMVKTAGSSLQSQHSSVIIAESSLQACLQGCHCRFKSVGLSLEACHSRVVTDGSVSTLKDGHCRAVAAVSSRQEVISNESDDKKKKLHM